MKNIFYLSLLLLCAFFSLSNEANAQTATSTTEAHPCPYLSDYVRVGHQNNIADVYKLQAYLHIVERIDVSFNGVFDAATQNGVKILQERYEDTILAPWGLTQPTGNVYITTKHFIDEWACGQELPYTAEETRILNSPRTSTSVVGQTTTPSSRPTVAVAPTVTVTPTVTPASPSPTQTVTLPNDTTSSGVTVVQNPNNTNTAAVNDGTSTGTDATSTQGTTTEGWLQSAKGSTIVIVIILAAVIYFIVSMLSRPKNGSNQVNSNNRNNQGRPNDRK